MSQLSVGEPMPPDIRISLQLFGRFGASTIEPSPRFIQIAGRHRRALLAYLAMRPNYAESRERLAALLWGDRFDKQARQNLRQSLAALRKEIDPIRPDALRFERDIVSLDPSCVAVDAREFLAIADGADDLERAIGLYAGPFLDGLDLDVEAFADWVRGERVRIGLAAARVFERYAEREDKASHGPQAISAAERLVSLDPLRERSQRMLLRILARHRGREASLAYAASVSRMLQRELDADLEPETKALLEEIRRSEIAPASAVRVPRAPLPDAVAADPEPGPAAPQQLDATEAKGAPAPAKAKAAQAAAWVWLPRSTAVRWASAGAGAFLALIAAIVASEQFQARPAREAVPVAGVAAFDGTWNGTISCAKTSFTRAPVKTTLALSVSNGTVSFTRPVYDPDSVQVVGSEVGTGTVAANGAISLAGTWPYPTRRTFTSSYSGVLRGDHGELHGTQSFRYDGQTEERACTIEVTR